MHDNYRLTERKVHNLLTFFSRNFAMMINCNGIIFFCVVYQGETFAVIEGIHENEIFLFITFFRRSSAMKLPARKYLTPMSCRKEGPRINTTVFTTVSHFTSSSENEFRQNSRVKNFFVVILIEKHQFSKQLLRYV